MDTEAPSLGDISVHYPYEWMHEFRPVRHVKDVFDPVAFPNAVAVSRIFLHASSSQFVV